MIKKLLPCLLLILSFVSWSQPDNDTLIKLKIWEPPPDRFEYETDVPDIVRDNQTKNEDTLVQYPDVEASFPGGIDSMEVWVKNNIISPDNIKERTVVYAKIIVTKKGSIINHKLYMRKVNGTIPIEIKKEVKRLLSIMPNWTPGSINGETVASYGYVRIIFGLGN